MFTRCRIFFLNLLLTVSLIIISHTALAAQASFSVLPIQPSPTPTSYITLATTHPIEKRKLVGSFSLDYGYKPLTVIDRIGVSADVVTHLTAVHVGLAYGLMDNLTLSVGVPVITWEKFTQIGGGTAAGKSAVDDIRIAASYRFFHLGEKRRVDFSASPFIFVPTNFGLIYAGTNRLTAGLLLLGDLKITPSLLVTLNLGIHGKPKVDSGDAHSATDFMTGLGVALNAGRKADFFLETLSRTAVDRFFSNSHSVILESRLGLGWHITDNVKLTTAVGAGFFDGIGSSVFRTLLRLDVSSDIFNRKRTPPAPTPVVVPTPEEPPPPTPTPKPRLKPKTNPSHRFLPIS